MSLSRRRSGSLSSRESITLTLGCTLLISRWTNGEMSVELGDAQNTHVIQRHVGANEDAGSFELPLLTTVTGADHIRSIAQGLEAFSVFLTAGRVPLTLVQSQRTIYSR